MTAWLPALLLAVGVAAAPETAPPAPAPVPSPAATALPEIGRVRANAACQTIVEHARVAITNAVHNDRRLLSLATVMDRVSPNAMVGSDKKVRAVDVFAQWASSIESDAVEAQGAIDRLRALAAASTDETRKRELKAFADALSGALGRQRYAAHEVQRGLFLIGARNDVAEARAIEDDPALGIKGAATSLDGTPLRTSQDSPKLRDIAATLADRIKLIKEDEHEGVRHEVGATNGC